MPENWVVPVRAAQLAAVWERSTGLIDKALSRSDGVYRTAGDILPMLEAKAMHLWLYGSDLETATGCPIRPKAAMISRTLIYPHENRLLIFAFASDTGEGRDCVRALSNIERIAKDLLGCSAVLWQSPRADGFHKWLPDYEPVATIMRKRL